MGEIITAVLTLLHDVGSWLHRVISDIRHLPEEIDDMKRKLSDLKSHLSAADRVKHRDLSIRTWVKNVRRAMRPVEDVIDEQEYDGGPLSSYGLVDKLRQLRPTILQLCKEPINIPQLPEDPTQRWAPDNGGSSHRADEITGEVADDLEGVEEHETTLEKWLTDDDPARTNDPRRTAVAVCGMPGIGKTTLVSRAYQKPSIRKRFDCHAWVCVSQTSDATGLLRSLATKLSDDKDNVLQEGLDRAGLVVTVRDRLRGKRYLIVLDDVWYINIWEEIRVAFQEYKEGCRIVVTTRFVNVGRSLAVDRRMLEVRPLDDDKALSLFCKRAFWRDDPPRCPRELEYWARKIVSKCSGYPLAVVVVGSHMALVERDPSKWRESYRNLERGFSGEPGVGDVVNVVTLSVNYLPYHLKMCFLYCSLFPEDYNIGRKLLIRLWTAMGFVENRRGDDVKTLEQIGEWYLRELVHRNMIQVVERNNNGRVRSCKLHDVVRSIAVDILKEEELLGQRWLSIYQPLQDQEQTQQQLTFSLRSLLAFAHDDLTSSHLKSCGTLKLLRVLDLRGVPITEVPPVVFNLKILRYLSLRDTKVKYEVFPKEIAGLRRLQTLDLWRTHVQGLPDEIGRLKELRHLMVRDVSSTPKHSALPKTIKNLKNLQTLKGFRASNPERDYNHLKELTQLRTLFINVIKNHPDALALCDAIARMPYLVSLKVTSAGQHNIPLRNFNPPPASLQKLVLNGKLNTVPHWFPSLQWITHLCLFDSNVSDRSPLDYLRELPRLVLLCLDNAYNGSELLFQAGYFKTLKVLYITELLLLKRVGIDKGALPVLQKLYILKCRLLTSVPMVENLKSLQELTVGDCGRDMVAGLRKICNYLENLKLLAIE